MGASAIVTGELPVEFRVNWAAVASQVLDAINMPVGSVRLEWIRPATAGDKNVVADVDARAAYGAVHHDHPFTVFLAQDGCRAPWGIAGVIAHELAHVGQIVGWVPSGPDREAIARRFAQDFGTIHEANPHDLHCFDVLRDDGHARAQLYRDVRAGGFADRHAPLAWSSSPFWGPAGASSTPAAPVQPRDSYTLVRNSDGERVVVGIEPLGPFRNGRQRVSLVAIPAHA